MKIKCLKRNYLSKFLYPKAEVNDWNVSERSLFNHTVITNNTNTRIFIRTRFCFVCETYRTTAFFYFSQLSISIHLIVISLSGKMGAYIVVFGHLGETIDRFWSGLQRGYSFDYTGEINDNKYTTYSLNYRQTIVLIIISL